jgi:hypothetical protein
LGLHTALDLFKGVTLPTTNGRKVVMAARPGPTPAPPPSNSTHQKLSNTETTDIFEALYRFWQPSTGSSPDQATRVVALWLDIHTKLRTDPKLKRLAQAIYDDGTAGLAAPQDDGDVRLAERSMLREILAVMERIYIAFNFEKAWQHSANAGVLQMITTWTRSVEQHEDWDVLKKEISPMFRDFLLSLSEKR